MQENTLWAGRASVQNGPPQILDVRSVPDKKLIQNLVEDSKQLHHSENGTKIRFGVGDFLEIVEFFC